MRLLLTGLAAALLTAPAVAQGPATAQAATPARPSADAAMALARLTLPRDLVIANELRIARQGLEIGFSSEPEGKALLAAYPKLLDEMWVAAEPEARRASEASHGRHERELAELLKTRLTAEQAAGLAEFYATPTGQKLIAGLYNSVDGRVALEKAAARPDMDVSNADLATMQRDATAKAVAQMKPEDEPALQALVGRVGVQALAAMGAAIQELGYKWAKESDTAFEERIGTILAAVVERHVVENAAAE